MVERVELGCLINQRSEKVLPDNLPKAKFVGMNCLEPNSLAPTFLYEFCEFKSAGNYFKEGDILYGRLRPYLNKVFIPSFNGAASGEFLTLIPNDFAYNKYLLYYLHSSEFVDFASHRVSGDRPRIRFDEICEFKILIYSLPEQRAIVAKIEQLFSELDDGIASLKKAQEQLKIYRQAVLKKAFEGELTKEWREQQTNLPSAEELLQEIKKEREAVATTNGKNKKPIKPITKDELAKLPKLPNSWAWVRLDEVTLRAEKVNLNYKNQNDEFKYFDIGGINNQTNKIESYKIYTWADAPSRAQQIIFKNDTLFSTVRTYLKNIAKVDKDEFSDEICSSGFTVIRGIEHYIDGSFIFYLSIYEGFLQPLNRLQTGTSYPAVRDIDVFMQPFPLYSLQEQQQIVQEIETRLSVCDNMEANIKEALFKAKALRQSILKKAFEGKLLDSQELEEVRKAPDWEPAEELLKRIKLEKTTTKKEKVS